MQALERRYGSAIRLALDRMRASQWRVRGAALGPKTRVGRHCIVERPWRLQTGPRVQIEDHVNIKIAVETASVIVGRESFVGYGSELDVSSELTIGSHVLIAPGCFITDHGHVHAVDASI